MHRFMACCWCQTANNVSERYYYANCRKCERKRNCSDGQVDQKRHQTRPKQLPSCEIRDPRFEISDQLLAHIVQLHGAIIFKFMYCGSCNNATQALTIKIKVGQRGRHSVPPSGQGDKESVAGNLQAKGYHIGRLELAPLDGRPSLVWIGVLEVHFPPLVRYAKIVVRQGRDRPQK